MREKHNNRRSQQNRSGKGKVKNKNRETTPKIKDKFVEQRKFEAPAIKPKTAKQEKYLHLLKTCNIIVVEGLFGTGKSYCAAATAADSLRKGYIRKIIVARPYVQTGKSSGSKPGTTLEKMYPYVRNILDTIKQRIGNGAYETYLRDGVCGAIEVQEVENIRGRSFDEDSYLIIDEAQQTTPEEMLSIVTRISDNCTLVLCGDDGQKDIKGKSGLAWFIDFAKRHNLEGVGMVNFNSPEDIVRGGVVRGIALGLAKDAKNGFEIK